MVRARVSARFRVRIRVRVSVRIRVRVRCFVVSEDHTGVRVRFVFRLRWCGLD